MRTIDANLVIAFSIDHILSFGWGKVFFTSLHKDGLCSNVGKFTL